jgi:hypothetical protein
MNAADRRQGDRRRPPRLEAPACPTCTTNPPGITIDGTADPRYVRSHHLKPDHEVLVCFRCQPCDVVWCAVKPLRRAA